MPSQPVPPILESTYYTENTLTGEVMVTKNWSDGTVTVERVPKPGIGAVFGGTVSETPVATRRDANVLIATLLDLAKRDPQFASTLLTEITNGVAEIFREEE